MMATMINPNAQRVIIEGVSWTTYECLLADFGDSHAARVAYDQGTLEIMAPSYAHEQLNVLIAMIISFIAAEMIMDFENAGSTTFKRADVGRGFEPDSCFYIQHVAAIRGKVTIDLDTDPPPDLVLEIDLTHPSLDKLPLYAAVGVPEVWRYTNDHLVMYRLTDNNYTVVETSGVLPDVARVDIQRWIEAGQQMPRTIWMKQVQGWALDRWGRNMA
jgi:Uma2 family endonuclease